MAFNGSGTFSIINTFVPGTVILSSAVNQNYTDIASGLSNCMCKDGQQIAAANQNLGNNRLTNLAAGSARSDSINLGQLQDGLVNWAVAGSAGTANAIIATYSPPHTALADGDVFFLRAIASTTSTTPTFNPDGLGAATITKQGGAALVAGDIPGAGAEMVMKYNLANTRFELLNAAFPVANPASLSLADQVTSGGANVTSLSDAAGNITIDCGARPLQFITNNGAFTITAPTNDGSCMLLINNGSVASTVTFSGFAIGSSTGDVLDNTASHKFTISIWRINGTSGYRVAAHQ